MNVKCVLLPNMKEHDSDYITNFMDIIGRDIFKVNKEEENNYNNKTYAPSI